MKAIMTGTKLCIWRITGFLCLTFVTLSRAVKVTNFCDQYSPTLSPTNAFSPTRHPTLLPTTGDRVPSASPTQSPSAKPTARPTAIPTANPSRGSAVYSLCEPYDSFSNGNTSICTFYTMTSGYVIVSACPQNGGECDVAVSDTYFKLVDSDQNVVAVNDDRCGKCSAITFKPASAECSVYQLIQYCYPNKYCAATTAITNGVVLFNITTAPSVMPTAVPTVVPSASVPMPTATPTGGTVEIDQLFALWDLYEATDGDRWSDNTVWNDVLPDIIFNSSVTSNFTMESFCDELVGVICEDNNVVSLSLSNNNLVGTLPESLLSFTALQSLDLGYNFLSSTIPSVISLMTTLQKINFGNNFLSGTVPNSLLDDSDNLAKLILRVNLFTGTLPQPTRDIATVNLEELELYENFLTGTISDQYCDLPFMDAFLIAGNDFTCYTICNPVNSGSVYDYLTHDDVPVCSGYQDRALCSLQDAFDVNKHVPDVEKTPVLVSVSDRYILGAQSDSDTLIHTDVYNYYQSDLKEYLLSFDESILRGDLRKYDDKYFTYNFIVKIGESNDGTEFSETFYCGFCTVGKSYSVDGVTFVNTGLNYPGTNGAAAYNSEKPYLSINVYIISNGDFALFSIPGYSFTLTEVSETTKSLWECNNDAVYVSNPCEWFGVTCDGVFVTELNLASLGLSAKIPTEIGRLTTMQILDLSHNSLLGTLPSTVGSLVDLVSIDVSNNVLTGTIPASFSGLLELEVMALYANQLSGSLPEFVGSLSSLTQLLLQSNNFQFQVPYEVCNLTNATVRLDGNSFSCYQPCMEANTTNIRYGSILECSPTQSPTPAPKKPLSAAISSVIAVIVLLAVVTMCGLGYAYHHFSEIQRQYKDFPVHKKIIDGVVLDADFVYSNVQSARRMIDGKTALQLLMDKLPEGYEVKEDVLYELVNTSLHFNPDTGDLLEDESEHNYAWGTLVQGNNDLVFGVVQRLLTVYDNYAELLANSVDKLGRKCCDIASPRCREAISQSVMLFRRFELKPGPPEHKSATSLVRFATRHTKDDELNSVQTPVALKFMKHRAQFVTEINARAAANFSKEYVIAILESYDGDSLEEDDVNFRLSALKKGFDDYPFCVVMDVADNCLQRVILQQHIAGHDWDYIKLITKSLCACIAHLHSRNIVHGDLKPLNVVMVKNSVRLIDFDASSRITNDDSCECAGSKFSSAYLPPELFFEKSAGKVIVKTYLKDPASGEPVATSVRRRQRSNTNDKFTYVYDHPAGYTLVRAAPSQDMWALGAIIYLLCTGVTLFQASVEDNIPNSEMLEACNWTDAIKEEKLAAVTDKYARNLLSLLLNADPLKRIGPERVTTHPFISGKQPERMIGEEAKFDVFLSYRVDSDSDLVQMIYNALTNMELKVWVDKFCLLPGQPWEEGFCDGLVNSSCFVCVLSRNAINHPDKSWQNFCSLEEGSRCDNVLLEWRLALELRDRYLIEGIFPVFVGDCLPQLDGSIVYSDYFPSGCHPSQLPSKPVAAVETKLRDHLGRQGLGLPLESSRTVRDVCDSITGNQGGFLKGEPNTALQTICHAIIQMRKQIQFRKFEEQSNKHQKFGGGGASVRGMTVEERNDFLLEENERLREENNQVNALKSEIELLWHEREKHELAELEIDKLNRELFRLQGKDYSNHHLDRYASSTVGTARSTHMNSFRTKEAASSKGKQGSSPTSTPPLSQSTKESLVSARSGKEQWKFLRRKDTLDKLRYAAVQDEIDRGIPRRIPTYSPSLITTAQTTSTSAPTLDRPNSIRPQDDGIAMNVSIYELALTSDVDDDIELSTVGVSPRSANTNRVHFVGEDNNSAFD
jgi:serine/threonine protein kinase/Leucine-rich repeat (LRR) protein